MMRTTLAIALAVCLWSGRADAAPITFSYAGEVTSVGLWDSLLPAPEPVFGSPFSGSYTFDPGASDGVPADGTTGSYTSSGGTFGLTLDVAGLPTFIFSSVSIGVTDGYSTFGFAEDQYLVGSSDGAASLSIRLTDFSEALFSGDALPLTPPALAGLFTEFFFTDGTQIDLGGTITSLACTAGCAAVVPEPASLSLVATGLGALALRRRRRH